MRKPECWDLAGVAQTVNPLIFLSYYLQRTPWGGGKKRGVENLTNDAPPKTGFWTPPRTVRFPPPSGVSALFFLYKNPRQSRPEALLEGSKNFRSLVRFPPPIRFAPPHITAQLSILGGRFGYFFYFFCSGRGKGESEAPGEGGSVFHWNSQEGGWFPGGGGGFQEGCLERTVEFFWGGAKPFFSGPKCPPSIVFFLQVQLISTVCILQGVFVKIGDFVKFKGFLVEFLQSRRSSENQSPQKIAKKADFSEPRLLQCT